MTAWSRSVDALSGTESATSLALFRVAMGVGVWHTVWPMVSRGLVDVLWVDVSDGGYLPLGDGPWLVALLGGPHPTTIWALVVVALAAATAMVVGVGGRAASLVALLASNSLTDTNPYAGGSYDMLMANGLWLCVVGSGEQTLSLTARLRTGQWWPRVDAWSAPRWLVGWQLVLMYSATGLQKLSAYWVPGGESSALYYILQQSEWQRRPMDWMAPLYPLTQVATTVTWCWEVSAPIWLLATWYAATADRGGRLRAWSNHLRVRWIYLWTGLFLHAGIFLTMDVGPFSYLSTAFYVAMVAPDEWEAWFARWRGR